MTVSFQDDVHQFKSSLRIPNRAAMLKQNISEDLKIFLREQIQTVLRLEVLLFLHRNQSGSFTIAQITNELGITIDVAQEQLRALAANNLVTQSNAEKTRYCYQPAERLRPMIDHLAATYSTQRVPILSLLLAERRDKLRSFTEAFRLTRGID